MYFLAVQHVSFFLLTILVPVYPISVPMQATGNQYSPSVYTAQVNKSKQMEEKLVAVKTSNFFDLKNDVNVGIKE